MAYAFLFGFLASVAVSEQPTGVLILAEGLLKGLLASLSALLGTVGWKVAQWLLTGTLSLVSYLLVDVRLQGKPFSWTKFKYLCAMSFASHGLATWLGGGAGHVVLNMIASNFPTVYDKITRLVEDFERMSEERHDEANDSWD